MPELPDAKQKRFCDEYGLSDEDANQLTASRDVAEYFESTAKLVKGQEKLTANWVLGELSAALNQNGVDVSQSPVNAERLSQLIARIADNTISGKIAKEVFHAMWESDKTTDQIIEEKGLQQISDVGELEAIVDQVIQDNPKQVEQYQSGKDKVFGFFVGNVMKLTKGKANPKQVNELLKSKLNQ